MAETTNFKLKLIDFDKIPWHQDFYDNMHIIDALMARYIAVSNVQGTWENATTATIGERYIDGEDDTIWEVLVAHTTPSTGTFSASRIADSANWQSITVDVSQATYTQNTAYTPNVFVIDGARYGVSLTTFTSDNAAATTALSYDADVTAGNIVTLIDFGDAIAATHDTNTVATGGTPTATYDSATKKFDFGLVTGATGATGPAGDDATGDLEAVNNLSDVADVSTSRTNLGLEIGADVQAHAIALDNVSGTNSGDEVSATLTTEGVVERSTSAENITGTDDTVYPTVAGTKEMINTHVTVSGWEFVEAVSASTSATIELGEANIDTGYDYLIIGSDIDCSTDANIEALIGTGGGPTYQTSNYVQGILYTNNAAITATTSTGAEFELSKVGGGGLSTEPLWFEVTFYNPGEAVRRKAMNFQAAGREADAGQSVRIGGGWHTGTAALTGFRLQPSAGTIVTGELTLMRRKVVA